MMEKSKSDGCFGWRLGIAELIEHSRHSFQRAVGRNHISILLAIKIRFFVLSEFYQPASINFNSNAASTAIPARVGDNDRNLGSMKWHYG